MAIAAYRYNNPFDVSLPIAGWNGGGDTVGIQGQPGFGAFPDMATGYKAGVQRLNSYITGQSSHGPKRTIKELNSVYATDPNWASGVASHSGLNPDDPLDAENADQMRQLQYGVMAQEIGPKNAAQILAEHGGGGGDNPVAAINSAAGIKAPAAGGGALSFAGGAQPAAAPAAEDQPALNNLIPADRKDNRFSLGSLFGASDDTKDAMHSFGARLTRAAAALSSGVNPHQSSALSAQAQALEADNKPDVQYMQGANGQLIRINKRTNEVSSIGIPDAQKESFMPVMGKDDNGNPTMTGTFNKSTGEFKPLGGTMASSGTPVGGDPELTGQERYDSLTTPEKAQIDAWRNGTGIMPSQYALSRNNQVKKMVDAANSIGIDMTKYGERQAFLKGMASKAPTTAGGQFISAPTVMDHLLNVANDYNTLGNSSGGGYSTGASLANYVKDMRGGTERQAQQTSADRNTDTASKEIVSFLTRGHGGVSERQDTHDKLYMPRAAPEVQAAALEAYRKQVADRFYELSDGAKGSVGEDHPELVKAEAAFKAKDAALQNAIATLKKGGSNKAPTAATVAKPGATPIPHASWEDAQKAGWK